MVKFCAKVQQQQPLLILAAEEATSVNKISLDTQQQLTLGNNKSQFTNKICATANLKGCAKKFDKKLDSSSLT